MDQKQLNAIKERVENATTGPWQVYEMEDGTHIGTAEHHPQLKSPMHVVTMSYWGEKPHSRIFIDQHNAEFIVNAIEDVPALLAEVERLQKSITWYDHEHSRLHNIGAETALENERLREMLIATRKIVRRKVSEVKTLQNACRKHKQVNQNLFSENEGLCVALREVLVNSHDKTFAHTIALQTLGGESND